jgi:hypothetical protein
VRVPPSTGRGAIFPPTQPIDAEIPIGDPYSCPESPKTHLDHTTSAAALNIIRLHAWWNGHPLDRGSHCHLARLQLSLTA